MQQNLLFQNDYVNKLYCKEVVITNCMFLQMDYHMGVWADKLLIAWNIYNKYM